MEDRHKFLKRIGLSLLILLPSFALASVFDILYPDEDLSLTYLNFLFGPLGSVGLYLTPNSLYFILIKILIFPLFFASAMGSWIVFTATLHSAQEGTFLGQKLASTTVIIRSVIGMGLLTPDHTGYAIIQKLMMSIIIAGIGLANTLWGIITDQYAQGLSLMQPITYDSSDQLVAQKMIGYAALMSYLQRQLFISEDSIIVDTSSAMFEQITVVPVSPSSDPGPLNIFLYTSSSSTGIPSAMIEGSNDILNVFAGQPLVTILVEWMIANPNTAIDVSKVFIEAGISTEDLNAWMINNYEITRQQLLMENTRRTNDITPYMQQGWIVAGSLYWKLSADSGDSKSYCDLMQPVSSTGLPTGSTSDIQSWLEKLSSMTFLSNTTLSISILNIQNQVSAYGTDSSNGQVRASNPIDARVSGLNFAFESLDNTFSKAFEGQDPIIGFVRDCQRMMKNVLVFFISTVVTLGAVSFIVAMRYQLPFVDMVFYMIGSILVILMTFTFIFIPPAAMGGYYLPLIPVLIYTGAALSWMMKVIEAIVAAPFIAVALIEPTKDEFGRAEAALALTLHVMLKPALMVIGLILGGRLATIALSSFSLPLNAYLTYKGFTVTSSNMVLERILIYILLNQVVVSMVVALASRSFSLIYKIPDQVFGWIGHREQGSEVSGMVSEAQQGAEQGIQMMTQIFQIGASVGKVSLEAMKTVSSSK